VLIDDFKPFRPYLVEEDKCTGCGNCIEVGCPAIHVTRRDKVIKPSGKEVELAFVASTARPAPAAASACSPARRTRSSTSALARHPDPHRQDHEQVMSQNDITNILVCGIGGQGVMTATEILAEAAIALGHDVKKTEVAGMAQRGGVVTSHLRFGRKVLSPQIEPGTVQVLLGFEGAEALRWSHYLRPEGLALVNTGRLVPPVVELGLFDYPTTIRPRCVRPAHVVVPSTP
jgi:ferredoxin